MKYHFPFYLQGQHDALNQSEPHKPTLDLFHLNMTTIILQKIRSVSLLFSSDRGWRLFKDKCSSVQDPRCNHTPPTQSRGETCLLKSCGCMSAHARTNKATCKWVHVDCLVLM